jgi:hypothetical protein
MNKTVFILLFIFILSRLLFINPQPIFFDSPEYMARFLNPNYFQSIASGHIPFHSGYLLLFWPVFHLSNFLRIDPFFAVIFIQIIMSSVAVYCFYRFVEIITDKITASISAIMCSLFPLYWIMNGTIMTESIYINLFLFSIFFIAFSLNKTIYSVPYLVVGCTMFGLAILTNPLVVFWIPFILSFTYFLKKKKIFVVLISIFLTFLLAIIINGYLISKASSLPIQAGIIQYIFGVDISLIPNISSATTVLRFARNTFVPIFQNYSVLVFFLSLISAITIFKKNTKLFVILVFWIIPLLIANQWYDPLLFGRHSSIAGFGLAVLAGVFLNNRKILLYFTIMYLVIFSVPALYLLRQPIPYLEEAQFVKTLPNGLLIESHFARPQVERSFPGETIFINQPGWSPDSLIKTIDKYLNKNLPVFISSQALSDPYGIYSGPYLYSLSLSYKDSFVLENILSSYSFKKYYEVDKNANIIMFRITSKQKSKYPEIPRLNFNRRQINYYDLPNYVLLFVERAKVIHSQNIMRE